MCNPIQRIKDIFALRKIGERIKETNERGMALIHKQGSLDKDQQLQFQRELNDLKNELHQIEERGKKK